MSKTGGIKLFTDDKNAAELAKAAGADKSLAGYLKAHLGRIRTGDYFAVLGYIEMNVRATRASCRRFATPCATKSMWRRAWDLARASCTPPDKRTKGGPNSGVFLQITCDDAVDLPVPGQKYTFGVVKAAQARGDFQVLAERGRRALRVHLGSDVKAGLATLLVRSKVRTALDDQYFRQPRETGAYVRRSGCNWEWWVWAGWART